MRGWLPRLHVLDGSKLAKERKGELEIQFLDETSSVVKMERDNEQEKEEEETVRNEQEKEEEETVQVKNVKKRKRGRSGVVSVETIRKKTKQTKDIFSNIETTVLSWNN